MGRPVKHGAHPRQVLGRHVARPPTSTVTSAPSGQARSTMPRGEHRVRSAVARQQHAARRAPARCRRAGARARGAPAPPRRRASRAARARSSGGAIIEVTIAISTTSAYELRVQHAEREADRRHHDLDRAARVQPDAEREPLAPREAREARAEVGAAELRGGRDAPAPRAPQRDDLRRRRAGRGPRAGRRSRRRAARRRRA